MESGQHFERKYSIEDNLVISPQMSWNQNCAFLVY